MNSKKLPSQDIKIKIIYPLLIKIEKTHIYLNVYLFKSENLNIQNSNLCQICQCLNKLNNIDLQPLQCSNMLRRFQATLFVRGLVMLSYGNMVMVGNVLTFWDVEYDDEKLNLRLFYVITFLFQHMVVFVLRYDNMGRVSLEIY